MSNLERIQKIMKENFAFAAVSASSSLRSDLCLDSLDDCELRMAIEEEFDVPVDDDLADKWLTVGDIEQFVNVAVADREMQGGGA